MAKLQINLAASKEFSRQEIDRIIDRIQNTACGMGSPVEITYDRDYSLPTPLSVPETPEPTTLMYFSFDLTAKEIQRLDAIVKETGTTVKEYIEKAVKETIERDEKRNILISRAKQLMGDDFENMTDAQLAEFIDIIPRS